MYNICCDPSQERHHVVAPFVVFGLSVLRDVTQLSFVEGRFEGSHLEIVEMMLSFSVVYVAVATATRLRVLEALLNIMRKIRRFLNSSASWAHNQLKCILVDQSRRDTKNVFG